MIDPMRLVAILVMALVTYLTRIGGYLFLRERTLSSRTMAVLECAPGCVLITVIAPNFVSSRPADLIALGITVIAAARFSILPTVLISIASAGILRSVL